MTSLKRGSVTGQALSLIYLHKVDLALLLVYNHSLTTASESRLFGSVVRALVLYRATCVRFPAEALEIFQLCFTLLWLSCRKNHHSEKMHLFAEVD